MNEEGPGFQRKVHNEGPYNLFTSLNIATAIKS